MKESLLEAKGKVLDATQEMLALGVCNVLGSFVSAMPATGSFTRTALNQASGVRTTLGGLFTGAVVLFALGILSATFGFIPKATLAGVILIAMYYMLDFSTYKSIWHTSRAEFLLMCTTFLFCLFIDLKYGILIGILLHIVVLVCHWSKPTLSTVDETVKGQPVLRVILGETIAFPVAEKLRSRIITLARDRPSLVLDCKNLKRMDFTVAKNLKLLAADLRTNEQSMVCENCCAPVTNTLKSVAPELLPAPLEAP